MNINLNTVDSVLARMASSPRTLPVNGKQWFGEIDSGPITPRLNQAAQPAVILCHIRGGQNFSLRSFCRAQVMVHRFCYGVFLENTIVSLFLQGFKFVYYLPLRTDIASFSDHFHSENTTNYEEHPFFLDSASS